MTDSEKLSDTDHCTTSEKRVYKAEAAMISAGALLSKRGQFWDVHKKIEAVDIEKSSSTDTCPSNSSFSQSQDLSTQDGSTLSATSSLCSPVKVNGIQLVHPGRVILNQSDTNTSFDAEQYLFESCKFQCDSPYSHFARHLHGWTVAAFRDIILKRNTTEFDTYTVEDRHILCKHLFFLMAMSKDDDVCDACYDILCYYGADWNPTLHNLLNAFIIWEDSVRVISDNLLQLAPGINPTMSNVSRVLDHLCALFTEAILHDSHRAGILFRALLLTVMDKRFCCSLLLNKFQTCFDALLNHIDASEWRPETVQNLCEVAHFGDDHFHNQAFICTQLLDTSVRTRRIRSCLALKLIQSLVDDTQGASYEMGSIATIVSSIVRHKEEILRLSFYQQYVLLNVVHSCIYAHEISEQDSVCMQQLVSWIEDFSATLPTEVTSWDISMIKGVIARVGPAWKSMTGLNIR